MGETQPIGLDRGAGPALTDAVRADGATAATVVRVAAEVGTQIDALDQGFDAAETDLGQGAGSPLTDALADGATGAAVVRVVGEVDADPTAVGLGQHAGDRRRSADTPFADLIGSGQALPQAPQLPGSIIRLTQTPPQLVSVSTQAIGGPLQIPPSQTPSGQTLPQAPQLFGSLVRSTQKPPHLIEGADTADD